jgi:hypothetical protein
MVRRSGKALFYALFRNHRPDLDDLASDHRQQLRIRVRPGVSRQDSPKEWWLGE